MDTVAKYEKKLIMINPSTVYVFVIWNYYISTLSSHLGFRTSILSLVLEMLINIGPYTVQSNKRWLLKVVKIIHS